MSEDFKIDEEDYKKWKGKHSTLYAEPMISKPRMHTVLSEEVKDFEKKIRDRLTATVLGTAVGDISKGSVVKTALEGFEGLEKTLRSSDVADALRYVSESIDQEFDVEPGCDFKELIKEL